jgi:hypothetical protein
VVGEEEGMIVGDEYVYVSPPKTGTRSMYRWLIDHYGGKRLSETEDHQRTIPDEHKDKWVFTTIRHPYERAVSIYWSMYAPRAYSRQKALRDQMGGATIDHLMRFFIEHHDEVGVGGMSISRFLENVEPVMYLDVCANPTCRLALPFKTVPIQAFPHENAIANAGVFVDEALAKRTKDLIWEWARRDFERWGYER